MSLPAQDLQQLLEQSQMHSWEWSFEDQNIQWSSQTNELFGLPQDTHLLPFEILTQSVHPEDFQRFKEELENISSSHQILFRFSFRSLKHGSSDFVYLSICGKILRQQNGHAFKACGIIWNAADFLPMMEQQTHHSKMLAIGQLASGIAHEINNPLAAIINYTYSLTKRLKKENALNPAETLQTLEKIDQLAQRIVHLIKALRTFSTETNAADLQNISSDQYIKQVLQASLTALKKEEPSQE